MLPPLLCAAVNVTQCNIAHALEKTKYRDADLKWCGSCDVSACPAALADVQGSQTGGGRG